MVICPDYWVLIRRVASDPESSNKFVTQAPRIQLQDIHGLWRRSWLRAPATFDDSTLVLWMQAVEWHVDMRLPAGVSEMKSVSSFSDLGADELRLLARAEGFAGTTAVRDSVCTWRRRINLQGPLKGIDTGSLSHVSEGLLETGLLSEYEELWQHADTQIPQGCRITAANGKTGVLLWTSTRFAMGLGWHDRLLDDQVLSEQVNLAIDRSDKTDLVRLFDQEFCFGRIKDGLGIIEHSTQPMRLGAIAFDSTTLSDSVRTIMISVTDFFGKTSMIEFQT